MDSTPPSHKSEPTHLRKSTSRLAGMMDDADLGSESENIPEFSVNFGGPSPQMRKTPSSTPSKLSSLKPTNSLPLQDLLLLSPSPVRRSRTRLSDRLEMADDPSDSLGSRRRCKGRIGSIGLLGCAPPRNSSRRTRRRIEQEGGREERDSGGNVEEMGKPKRKGKSRKVKLGLVPSVPSSSNCPNESSGDPISALDGLGQLIGDLIMWRDVAKTSLWFGFGCLCFLSSCFTKGLRFSLLSVISQLGLLILGVSFLSNILHKRDDAERSSLELKLNEEDLLRVARVVLPVLNLVISKAKELFSGEPSVTLKVASFLLLGAEYGHLLTLWRLFAIGFFISFTAPKLYWFYSAQIDKAGIYFRTSSC
ncbi:hypothetical protein Dimus_019836 [Dionaea muscipula]